ncbi:MAG: alpha/beta hydrolase [Verrucomicrobiae bacterium]|nr:alpha/beta hydrolase [Verrucomicrobiae bacterium]
MSSLRWLPCWVLLTFALNLRAPGQSDAGTALLPIEARVTHGFATNNGVRLHYARLGEGPLVVLIHGFPDFWLTWRGVMEALAGDYEVVAYDQRGFNLSDRPGGEAAYDMAELVSDLGAVIRARGRDRAVVIGHDWGGAVAWMAAQRHPEWVERLVILNLPHPRGLARELANNPEQQAASAYARRFQQPGAAMALTAEGLAFWVTEPPVKARYIEAFRRSDFEALMAYYRRNYPREPYVEDPSPLVKVPCPVLMIHGLADTALLSPALNGNWDFVEKDLTLVTIPGAGHFVQQDAPELVQRSLRAWLNR